MYVKSLNLKYVITIIIDSKQMSCLTTTSSKATTHNTQTKLNGGTSTLQLRGRQQCVDDEAIEAVGLSRKCRHFLCRQKLILKTSIRVFPTRRHDTPTCRRHHAVSGFFLVFCVVSSIADMSIRAVEMS